MISIWHTSKYMPNIAPVCAWRSHTIPIDVHIQSGTDLEVDACMSACELTRSILLVNELSWHAQAFEYESTISHMGAVYI